MNNERMRPIYFTFNIAFSKIQKEETKDKKPDGYFDSESEVIDLEDGFIYGDVYTDIYRMNKIGRISCKYLTFAKV